MLSEFILYEDHPGISFLIYVRRQHLVSDDILNQFRCPQDILIMIVLARELESDRNAIEQLRII